MKTNKEKKNKLFKTFPMEKEFWFTKITHKKLVIEEHLKKEYQMEKEFFMKKNVNTKVRYKMEKRLDLVFKYQKKKMINNFEKYFFQTIKKERLK